ncbi:MAG TPA: glycosyltransferase family 39 protein [Nitrospirota bacterium]|nr:glycosyltransferase family 39 protein [Nitrospirota bacterium]
MKINILSLPALILLFLLWIIPGTVGREPWKADEPYSFNIVYNMIKTGDWVVPSLAGEAFLEKPPLLFLTAAGFGRLFSPPLELYDAARMAAAFYMFLSFLFFALTARELFGKENAAIAVILLLGCVHLQVTAHKLITDVGLFSGFSIALYGFALSRRRRIAGGFWIGAGAGIGFLTKGLLAPGVIGVTAAALPVLFHQWRRKDYGVSLVAALIGALPWIVIWPAALYRRSPDFFVHWLWDQNFGRFLGFNRGSVGFNAAAPDSHSYYILNLVWIAWPVVLPAFWALWRFRRSWREHPLFQIPLVAFIVMIVILSASSTNRALYAVPMLLPITLIAVPGINLLPLKAKLIANRSSVLFFSGVALLLWLGWFAMMTGSPVVIAQRLHEFQPDYVPSVNGVLLAAAVLYSLAWLCIVIKVTRSPEFAVVNWTLGVVLTWGLVMTLWLPALNAGSGYRDTFTALKKSMPDRYACLASVGLGESERGMLEYFTGIQPRRTETSGLGNCDLLLEQRGGASRASAGPPWQKMWECKRPSNHPTEIFTLYRKGSAP